MKEKININTNLIRALKERVKRSQALVETVRKNYNEFLGYWLICYDAASFNALDLFEPNLFDASLKFNPGDFYNKYYERTGRDSKKYYESTGKFDIPKKFSDGPMLLDLVRYETDAQCALFIPTACLTDRNRCLYYTLKKYTPKDCFPAEYFTESSNGVLKLIHPDVTHAVVLYSTNQDGDDDISVHWLQDNLGFRYSVGSKKDFITVRDIFDHLWDDFRCEPFSIY